jgi:hypothetical protein
MKWQKNGTKQGNDFEAYLLKKIIVHNKSVCSPTVRIIAFQAIDPGSTPGRRIFLFLAFGKHHILELE